MRNKRGRSFDEAHYVHASFDMNGPWLFKMIRYGDMLMYSFYFCTNKWIQLHSTVLMFMSMS
ncbi:hypothetical protein BBG47_09515 [Paenibacillus sp. KS1]|nr:hypothetical protein BBG47_09515 [Paenibacillus sp. KS1]